MNKNHLPLGAAVLLTLVLVGCETDGGISARTQEKSAVYATLKPWEKKYIEKGTVAVGFTPDMVYMAMGHPDKVESKDLPEGHVDLWTYSRYYPDLSSIHGFQSAKFTAESAYQPQPASMQTATGGYAKLIAARMPELTAVRPLLTLEGLRLTWSSHAQTGKD